MAELKAKITYTEFLEWLQYIRWEEGRRTKQDAYLAQIATEVRRSYIKSPKSVKMKDFFLGTAEQEEKADKSKETWLAALKVNPAKN